MGSTSAVPLRNARCTSREHCTAEEFSPSYASQRVRTWKAAAASFAHAPPLRSQLRLVTRDPVVLGRKVEKVSRARSSLRAMQVVIFRRQVNEAQVTDVGA